MGAGDDEYFSKADAVIKLKEFFIRRGNIYLIDYNDQIKKINANDTKMQKPLKRCHRIMEPKSLVEL